MIDTWLTATDRYLARPECKISLPPNKRAATWLLLAEKLLAFIRSQEGLAASLLLKASDSFIILMKIESSDESPVIRSVMISDNEAVEMDRPPVTALYGWGPHGPSKIIIDPSGFVPRIPLPVHPTEFALKLLEHSAHTDIIEHLRTELTKIAARS